MSPAPLLAFLALVVGACTDTDDSAADTSDTDADTDVDTDADVDPVGALTGTLLFGDGTPAEGAEAQVCLASCRYTEVGADGSFTFTSLDAGRYSLHFVAEDDGVPCAEGLVPVDVQEGLTTEVTTPYYALPFTDDTPITETTTGSFPAGESLTLDVDGATLQAPFGVELAIQGIRMPPQKYPDLSTLDGAEVLDLWYLGAFNTEASVPVPFSVAVTYGLADTDQVGIRVTGYIEADWLDAGTATVSGGVLTSDVGSGLPYLTTLALVRLD